MNKKALVSVIVVTYNSSEHINGCLGPIVEADDFEIIVVDNLSTDDSVVRARQYSSVVVLANDENVGFARAVNQAASRASGEVILLLNPDCRVGASDLRSLAEQVLVDQSIGILAPTISHPEGRLQVRSAGYEPTLAHMAVHSLGLARRALAGRVLDGFNLYPAGETPPLTRVDWVSGACFAIRSDLWAAVGGLSERWFMYAEDIELCRRVRLRGFVVAQDSTTQATHEVGASSEVPSGPVFTMWIESLADYYHHVFKPSRAVFLAWKYVVSVGLSVRAIRFSILARRDKSHATVLAREAEKFRAYARAVVSFRPLE